MTALILMQSRILLTFSARVYCWLLVCLLPTRTPNAFSVELPSSSLAAVCTGAWGYSSFYPRCRIFHLLFLNFMRALAHFSSLPKFIWMAAWSTGVIATAPRFMPAANPLTVQSSIIQVIKEVVKHNMCRFSSLRHVFHMDFVLLISILWSHQFSQFSAHIINHFP